MQTFSRDLMPGDDDRPPNDRCHRLRVAWRCRPRSGSRVDRSLAPKSATGSNGSASAGRPRELTAGKLTPKFSHRIADTRGRQWTTLSGHLPIQIDDREADDGPTAKPMAALTALCEPFIESSKVDDPAGLGSLHSAGAAGSRIATDQGSPSRHEGPNRQHSCW